MCGKLPHVETLSSPDNYSFVLFIAGCADTAHYGHCEFHLVFGRGYMFIPLCEKTIHRKPAKGKFQLLHKDLMLGTKWAAEFKPITVKHLVKIHPSLSDNKQKKSSAESFTLWSCPLLVNLYAQKWHSG